MSISLETLKIKGAKIMTPEEMFGSQKEMQSKLIVAGWHYPYTIYVFIKISVNSDKIEQIARHDDYAGYMDDYNLQVKSGDGISSLLDGHSGTKYYVFDDLTAARKAVKLLNKLYETNDLGRSINSHLTSLSENLRIGKNIAEDYSPAIDLLKSQFKFTLNEIWKKHNELLDLLIE